MTDAHLATLRQMARSSDDLSEGDREAVEAGLGEIERLKEEFSRFISVVACTKKSNTPEFMEKSLIPGINRALCAIDCGDRVEWPGRWANEMHLVSGG